MSKAAKLAELVASFAHDPLGYVLAVFPWGEPGELEHEYPREWQIEELSFIRDRLMTGAVSKGEVIKSAVSSGHGVGKSALVSWIVKWGLDTCPEARIVVTANTEAQLLTKTWPEIAKWNRLSLTAHLWNCTATGLYRADKALAKNWFANAVTWTENNTEAFAGLHNKGKRLMLVFDESGGIADKVWEVSEGALTDADTEILWLAYGNPTRPKGRFHKCFFADRHRWRTRQIDSRKVKGTNLVQINKWVEDHGEDSDFVRVRVRGLFPNAADGQFIDNDVIAYSKRREIEGWEGYAKVIGVDVARHGADASCFVFRQGPKIHRILELRIRDIALLATRLIHEMDEFGADAVFVDATGMGWGVVDTCRLLGKKNVVGIQVGEASSSPEHYRRMRDELWGKIKGWIKEHGQLPSDPVLEHELTNIEHEFNDKGQLVMESKDEMKARGESSPNRADALGMTFARPVTGKRETKLKSWRDRLNNNTGSSMTA